MSLLDEASPGRPFTTSQYFLADIAKKKKEIWTILTNSYRRFPSVFEHVDDQADNKL